MYAVTSPAKGVLEINYMWLPAWVGMNSVLLEEMGKAVSASVVGKPLNEAEKLGHEAVVSFLTARYPHLEGLARYLNALKLVSIDGQEAEEG
jgi:hypothetical protein